MKLEEAVEKITETIYKLGCLLSVGMGWGYFVILGQPETFGDLLLRFLAGLICGLFSWVGVGILIAAILGKVAGVI